MANVSSSPNVSSSLSQQASQQSSQQGLSVIKWPWFVTGCSCLLAGSLYLAMSDLQGGFDPGFSVQALSDLASQGSGPDGESQ